MMGAIFILSVSITPPFRIQVICRCSIENSLNICIAELWVPWHDTCPVEDKPSSSQLLSILLACTWLHIRKKGPMSGAWLLGHRSPGVLDPLLGCILGLYLTCIWDWLSSPSCDWLPVTGLSNVHVDDSPSRITSPDWPEARMVLIVSFSDL
jgi:hypothetical protein